MVEINVDIPDRIDAKITRLVDEGEYLTREEAIRELLSTGIQSHMVNDDDSGDEDIYDDGMMGHDDEYVF